MNEIDKWIEALFDEWLALRIKFWEEVVVAFYDIPGDILSVSNFLVLFFPPLLLENAATAFLTKVVQASQNFTQGMLLLIPTAFVRVLAMVPISPRLRTRVMTLEDVASLLIGEVVDAGLQVATFTAPVQVTLFVGVRRRLKLILKLKQFLAGSFPAIGVVEKLVEFLIRLIIQNITFASFIGLAMLIVEIARKIQSDELWDRALQQQNPRHKENGCVKREGLPI